MDNNSLWRRLKSTPSSIHFKFTASQPLHLPIYNIRLPVLGSRLLLSLSSTNFHSIDILIYPVYLFYPPLTWSGCRQKSWVRSLMNRMLLLFFPLHVGETFLVWFCNFFCVCWLCWNNFACGLASHQPSSSSSISTKSVAIVGFIFVGHWPWIRNENSNVKRVRSVEWERGWGGRSASASMDYKGVVAKIIATQFSK